MTKGTNDSLNVCFLECVILRIISHELTRGNHGKRLVRSNADKFVGGTKHSDWGAKIWDGLLNSNWLIIMKWNFIIFIYFMG